MFKSLSLKVIIFGFIFTFFSSFGQSFFLGLFNPSIRETLSITHGHFGSIYASATLLSSFILIWVGKKIDDIDISKGAAQSWQMENRYKTMIDDKFDFGFAVDWMRKDLKIAMDEAKNNGSLLPVTELVDKFYGEVQNLGGNRWDTSSLIKRFRK